ncbi:hypothetical protein E4K72_15230 [Oxalobacteraceae bacterium OM1]|nr:hypothetical protein E4K72_15230 [Oxalobacteraceae bacterium OM1]
MERSWTVTRVSPQPAGPQLYTADQPDPTNLSQIHLGYLTQGGIDDGDYWKVKLQTVARDANAWLMANGGNHRFRWDMYNGYVDTTKYVLLHADAYYDQFGVFKRDEIERELLSRGLLRSDKKYVVFYEGHDTTNSCADSPGTNNTAGVLTIVYLNGDAGDCRRWYYQDGTGSYSAKVVVHELIHSLTHLTHVPDTTDIFGGAFLDPAINHTMHSNYYYYIPLITSPYVEGP